MALTFSVTTLQYFIFVFWWFEVDSQKRINEPCHKASGCCRTIINANSSKYVKLQAFPLNLLFELFLLEYAYWYWFFNILSAANIWEFQLYYTPVKSWMGYIFTSICLCVCLSVHLQTKLPIEPQTTILTRSLINNCLLHWLEPSWNWWPLVEGEGPIDVIFLLHSSLLTSLLWISAVLCLIEMKFGIPYMCVLCKFAYEFHKNRMT